MLIVLLCMCVYSKQSANLAHNKMVTLYVCYNLIKRTSIIIFIPDSSLHAKQTYLNINKIRLKTMDRNAVY